jgi:hypothetical protein
MFLSRQLHDGSRCQDALEKTLPNHCSHGKSKRSAPALYGHETNCETPVNIMKTPLRRNSQVVWFNLFFIGLALNGFGQPYEPPAKQLSPGKQAGTFSFTYSGQVKPPEETVVPVTVTISGLDKRPVAQFNITNENPFTFSADLPPGSYIISGEAGSADGGKYWPMLAGRFFISRTGMANFSSPVRPLFVSQKIDILSPKLGETVAGASPLLKWQPVDGAVEYRVSWSTPEADGRSDNTGASGRISVPEFQMLDDLAPGKEYQWTVQARGSSGQRIGDANASFFTSGAQATSQAGGPNLCPDTVPSKPGDPYLGASLKQNPGTLPGLSVAGIAANSPAIKAGLEPNDVLTSFNGHRLKDVSVVEFVNLVHEVAPGRHVIVEYVRNGVATSVPVTIEAKP